MEKWLRPQSVPVGYWRQHAGKDWIRTGEALRSRGERPRSKLDASVGRAATAQTARAQTAAFAGTKRASRAAEHGRAVVVPYESDGAVDADFFIAPESGSATTGDPDCKSPQAQRPGPRAISLRSFAGLTRQASVASLLGPTQQRLRTQAPAAGVVCVTSWPLRPGSSAQARMPPTARPAPRGARRGLLVLTAGPVTCFCGRYSTGPVTASRSD